MLLFLAATAWADDPTCPDAEGLVDAHAHLRALSLDLRGVVPTPEEHAAVEAGAVPEELIDGWLASPEFAERAVRFHRALLWNNVTNVELLATSASLSSQDGIYWQRNRADEYRGAPDTHCGDFEATLDTQGRPIPVDQGDGTVREGWAWVEPYWDPDTPLKVCAFEAQTRAVTAIGTDCATTAAFSDPACGCGPNLSWCGLSSVHDAVVEAMSDEVDHRVRANVLEDRSWLDLLTGSSGFVNGPMVDFYQHRRGLPSGVRFTEAPLDVDALPDLEWTEDGTWVEVDLGPQHSGVLTSPAFLLRFQTGRARANRFYNAFLCQPFQPPEGGIPYVDDAAPSLDLSTRDGCKYCHALLEPSAAYWGRWAQGGAGYLDPGEFPAYSESCFQCATGLVDCSEECTTSYLTSSLSGEQDEYLGWLNAYVFLEERHQANVEHGPELLVEQGVADGRVPRCAAEQAATWLLGRPVEPEDDAWLDALAADFVGSDYSWRSLVKAVVTSETYRRVR